jgi:plastocyanin
MKRTATARSCSRNLGCALLVAAVSSACSKPGPELPAAAPPLDAGAATSAAAQTVAGKLPPSTGGFPAILILQAQVPHDMAPAAAPLMMDQIQQTFLPPVLMVQTGQPVQFRNSDDVLHNVRVREDATHSPAFNVAIPTGEQYVFTFPRDGFYDVGCDIHPGMAAQIIATTNGYTAVADADGNFVMENVPAGAYKATLYTGAQKIERDVTVATGATTLDLR